MWLRRTGLNINNENFLLVDLEETELFNKAWEKVKDYDKQNGIGSYEMEESDFPRVLEKVGFSHVNVNFITIVRYAPDNDGITSELAKIHL